MRPTARFRPLLLALAIAATIAACGSEDRDVEERAGALPPSPTAVDEPGAPAESPLPAPDAPLPATAPALAERLTATDQALTTAIARWTERGTQTGEAPHDVTLLALYHQRLHRRLVRDRALAARVLPRLDPPLRRRTSETVGALRNLRALSAGWRPRNLSRFRGGRALPAGELLRLYRRAERRFGVDWEVLAAVNFVETQFNKLRNNSVAGAQGPMQFIPATWRAYGMGGNIRDPRDAIPAAANLLRANGAPRSYRRALYAYNPSGRYVRAVLAYSRQMARDERRFHAFYAWQVFVRTRQGERRITGPGL